MLIDQQEREITRKYPDSIIANGIQIHLAKLRLKREFSKTCLIKFIIKQLNKCS